MDELLLAGTTCSDVEETTLAGCAAGSVGVGAEGARLASLRWRKVTYAFTKAAGLNFGRHIGNHDAAAEKLTEEEDCTVFMRI